MSEVTARIVSIGTELTEGIIRDAHGQYLSSELTRRGVEVLGIGQIPDDERAAEYLKNAARDADLLIVTGGLGPTTDDMTRDALASLLGVELEYREEVWERISRRYPALSGRANRRQAMIPSGCDALDNPAGTAPGFRGITGTTRFFVLPGPPRELTAMAELHLFPALAADFKLPVRQISQASVFLIGESRLEEACRAVFDASEGRFDGVQWGTRVQERRISLYLRGGGEVQRAGFIGELKERMGNELIREGDVSPEELLKSALEREGTTFSIAESCTGGMTGSILTSLAGVSGVFHGGVISYSDSLKQALLGVRRPTIEQYGAVSGECAVEMAEGMLSAGGSGIACSITGIAGPGGGSTDKPVGTVWFALAGNGRRSVARKFLFGFNRDSIRRRASVTAMLLSEMYLAGDDALDMCRFWQYS